MFTASWGKNLGDLFVNLREKPIQDGDKEGLPNVSAARKCIESSTAYIAALVFPK